MTAAESVQAAGALPRKLGGAAEATGTVPSGGGAAEAAATASSGDGGTVDVEGIRSSDRGGAAQDVGTLPSHRDGAAQGVGTLPNDRGGGTKMIGAIGRSAVLGEAQARVALMRATDVGDTIMGRLVMQYGASGAVEAVWSRRLPPEFVANETTQRERPPNLAARLNAWYARIAAANPAADLEAGKRAGARLVIPGAPEWPTQLDQLGPGRPLALWVHGAADLRFSCLKSVAVVGARAATAYGTHIAAEFGVGLSEEGWTVVSGGAFGIDGAAHRGALAADSPTVVVLACGVDVCYPSSHDTLFAAVRKQGVVISECPPGVHPTRARFLIRNRLIAALSRGTVVVEAAIRSGALNTATHALSLNRHLAAVPGPITSGMSAGCHKLLRERKAVCVTSPEEMIDLVGVIGDDLAPHSRAPAVARDKLNEVTKKVLDAIPSRGGAGPASIAVESGIGLDATLSALGGLAAAGYIERTDKGWRLRKQTTSYRKASDAAALEPPAIPQPDPAEYPPFPDPEQD